jgi:solute carrier family 25 carnitine/acylcarnitine transporter 20/29
MELEASYSSKAADLVRKLLASMVAGGTTILLTQPFDVIKTRLQISSPKTRAASSAYSIITTEGIHALWKGTLPSFVALMPYNFAFTFYEIFKRSLATQVSMSPNALMFLSGSLTGVVNAVLVTPLDRIRVMQQANTTGHTRSARAVYREVGMRGLYKGFNASLLEEALGSGLYYLVFDHALSSQVSNFKLMTAGGFAGVAYWAAVFPIDCIKTRMQADCLKTPQYSSALDCLRQTVRSDGVLALYRGFMPVILRTMPANAIFIVLYGNLLRLNAEMFGR